MQWFRGGLVIKAHRLCVSLNSRLESNEEEEKTDEPASDLGSRLVLCLWYFSSDDRLRVGWLNGYLIHYIGGVPREQKMLKGHLPRVIYHQVY